jgi:hypothetical protein
MSLSVPAYRRCRNTLPPSGAGERLSQSFLDQGYANKIMDLFLVNSGWF